LRTYADRYAMLQPIGLGRHKDTHHTHVSVPPCRHQSRHPRHPDVLRPTPVVVQCLAQDDLTFTRQAHSCNHYPCLSAAQAAERQLTQTGGTTAPFRSIDFGGSSCVSAPHHQVARQHLACTGSGTRALRHGTHKDTGTATYI